MIIINKQSKSFLILLSVLLSFLIIPNSSYIYADPSVYTDLDNLNVILLIGDGMGYEHVKMAQWVEIGKEVMLDFQNLTVTLNVTTRSADDSVTDSAAAATAIACGIKTNNGVLGLDPSLQPVENIINIAQNLNKPTGLISTAYATHATPAGFYAHVSGRYDAELIESQMIDSGVDILMGGGASYFSASQLSSLEANGYSIVYNRDELLNESSSKICGFFGNTYMELEASRNYSLTPSLSEMTAKAIDVLSVAEDGFFLMVEGAQIDLEAHDGNTINVVLETIAFFEAVTVALEYAKSTENTIVIVTADHETGGLIIKGDTLNTTLPAEKATEEEKRALRIARANMLTVDWTSTYHTGVNVPLYGYGNLFESLENGSVIDNTDIFSIMKAYMTKTPLIISEFPEFALFVIITAFGIIIYLHLNRKNKK